MTDLLEQIAERLAAEGWASLRYDKRSSAPHHARIRELDLAAQNAFLSFPSFVGDAEAGLGFLRTRPEVDAARTGILGHSEGGLIALQVAHDAGESDRPAVLVLAGTAGRTLGDVVSTQIERALAGQASSERERLLDALDRAIAQVVASRSVPADFPAELAVLFPPSALELLQVELALDPCGLAPAYPGPVLVLQGEKDAQVEAEENTRLLRKAFQRRKGAELEVFLVPRASHNLKAVSGPLDPGLTGAVVPAALDRLVAWLEKAVPAAR